MNQIVCQVVEMAGIGHQWVFTTFLTKLVTDLILDPAVIYLFRKLNKASQMTLFNSRHLALVNKNKHMRVYFLTRGHTS